MRIPAATILPTLPAIVALIIAGLFAVIGNAQASPAHYRVVGYATGWNPLQDKDAGKIDTLIFAFAQLQQGRVTLDAARTQRLRQLIALKATHPRLTVEISVGGWSIGGFSEAAATEAGRRVFADSAAQLVAEYDADGLDVDWEYPGHHESGIQSSPQDRAIDMWRNAIESFTIGTVMLAIGAGVIWFVSPNAGLEIGYDVLWLLPKTFCADLSSCTLQGPVLGLRFAF